MFIPKYQTNCDHIILRLEVAKQNESICTYSINFPTIHYPILGYDDATLFNWFSSIMFLQIVYWIKLIISHKHKNK